MKKNIKEFLQGKDAEKNILILVAISILFYLIFTVSGLEKTIIIQRDYIEELREELRESTQEPELLEAVSISLSQLEPTPAPIDDKLNEHQSTYSFTFEDGIERVVNYESDTLAENFKELVRSRNSENIDSLNIEFMESYNKSENSSGLDTRVIINGTDMIAEMFTDVVDERITEVLQDHIDTNRDQAYFTTPLLWTDSEEHIATVGAHRGDAGDIIAEIDRDSRISILFPDNSIIELELYEMTITNVNYLDDVVVEMEKNSDMLFSTCTPDSEGDIQEYYFVNFK